MTWRSTTKRFDDDNDDESHVEGFLKDDSEPRGHREDGSDALFNICIKRSVVGVDCLCFLLLLVGPAPTTELCRRDSIVDFQNGLPVLFSCTNLGGFLFFGVVVSCTIIVKERTKIGIGTFQDVSPNRDLSVVSLLPTWNQLSVFGATFCRNYRERLYFGIVLFYQVGMWPLVSLKMGWVLTPLVFFRSSSALKKVLV